MDLGARADFRTPLASISPMDLELPMVPLVEVEELGISVDGKPTVVTIGTACLGKALSFSGVSEKKGLKSGISAVVCKLIAPYLFFFIERKQGRTFVLS